jgi:nitric oxide reductase NorD protein
MSASPRQHERELRAELSRNLALFFFESAEVASILAELDSLGRESRPKALALCVFLSNISGNIVPKVVRLLKGAAGVLSDQELRRWILEAFDLLDAKGLEPAVRFLSANDEASLRAWSAPRGLELDDVSATLETYIRGISGRDLAVKPTEDTCYTDTAGIFLPRKMALFTRRDKNFLAYKLMATHAWAQIELETFAPVRRNGESKDIEEYFGQFEERELAIDVFNILEALRVESFLGENLPGLLRAAREVKEKVLVALPEQDGRTARSAFVRKLRRQYLAGRLAEPTLLCYRQSPARDLEALEALYERAMALPGPYSPLAGASFPVAIKPGRVALCLKARQKESRERLTAFIDKVLEMPDFVMQMKRRAREKKAQEKRPEPGRKYLLLKGALFELDPEMEELLRHNGGIPGVVLVDGSELGGGESVMDLRSLVEEEAEAPEVARPARGGIPYDEWDYRRGAYRKGWCTLYEHDVHPVREPFVEKTLRKYGGYITVLRNRFEMLRAETRILKRQKDGEGIDIDAAVEALADARAGLSPSENVFTKLVREERNIAVLFLLDMSGSTKGWINESEKEALVLMSEALESLGDRYAIYGFSGITRNRADFYRVKSFGESYGEEVKRRIAGIEPKDYTRMGAALRHATRILRAVEARTKLLITLSDGKPEDYDAYKGAYGIEDTRRSLIEAKQQGIHSFCITIDREAHEYLPHMYGEVNYTYIDDVRKLPGKMTDIYTRLTT